MAVLGADIGIYLDQEGEGEVLVAALRDASVSSDLEQLPIAPEVMYKWKEYIPGKLSWGATCSTLVLMGETPAEQAASHRALRDAQTEMERINVLVRYPDDAVEEGEVYVQGITREWDYNNLLHGSYTLVGVPPLESTVGNASPLWEGEEFIFIEAAE